MYTFGGNFGCLDQTQEKKWQEVPEMHGIGNERLDPQSLPTDLYIDKP